MKRTIVTIVVILFGVSADPTDVPKTRSGMVRIRLLVAAFLLLSAPVAVTAQVEPKTASEVAQITDQQKLAKIAQSAEYFSVRVEAARRLEDPAMLEQILKKDTNNELRHALEITGTRIIGRLWISFAGQLTPDLSDKVYFIPFVQGAPRVEKFNGQVVNPSGALKDGRFTIELTSGYTHQLEEGMEFTFGTGQLLYVKNTERFEGPFYTYAIRPNEPSSPATKITLKGKGFIRTINVGDIQLRRF